MLKLSFGLSFPDLYDNDGLARVDAAFLAFLGAADASLARRLQAARSAAPDAKAESALILEICPLLERFLAQLFGIADEVLALARRHEALDALYRVKRQFVQRRAATKIKPADVLNIDGPALETELAAMFDGRFDELAFSTHVEHWSEDETAHADALDKALRYAAWALHTPAGRERHHAGLLFKQATKVDTYRLLSHARQTDADGVTAFSIAPAHLRRRRL